MGWRETTCTELTGADGGPLRVGVEPMTNTEAAAQLMKLLAPYIGEQIATAIPPLPPGALPPIGVAPESAWALIEKSSLEPYQRLEAWSAWNRRNAGIERPADTPEETGIAPDTPRSDASLIWG
jgi:hypothetical protein